LKNQANGSHPTAFVCWRSVFKTLVDEIKFGGKLTGRDDPHIITIANDYFKLDEIPKLDIIIDLSLF
jgi:hypothetical protein